MSLSRLVWAEYQGALREVERLRREIDRLDRRCEDITNQARDWKMRTRILADQKKHFAKLYSEASGELDALRQARAQERAAPGNAQAEFEQLKADLAMRDADLEECRRDLRVMRESRDAHKDDAKALRQQTIDDRRTLAKKQKTIDSYREQYGPGFERDHTGEYVDTKPLVLRSIPKPVVYSDPNHSEGGE